MMRHSLIALLLMLLCSGSTTGQDDVPVPVKVQYPLFLKIMSLDRELPTRVGDELVIGVVYQPQIRESWRIKDDFMEVVRKSKIRTIKDIPVRCVPIPLESTGSLESMIAEQSVDVLYVGPLRAIDIDGIAQVTRARHIATLTGVPEYVEEGLAVGIELVQDQPGILINLKAARAEGTQFNTQLLRLARVIEP